MADGYYFRMAHTENISITAEGSVGRHYLAFILGVIKIKTQICVTSPDSAVSLPRYAFLQLYVFENLTEVMDGAL